MRKEPGRDVGVVLEEVALGQAELGPEELLEIRKTDGAGRETDLDVVGVAGKVKLDAGSALTPALSRGERGT
jgi:hypothetical protein